MISYDVFRLRDCIFRKYIMTSTMMKRFNPFQDRGVNDVVRNKSLKTIFNAIFWQLEILVTSLKRLLALTQKTRWFQKSSGISINQSINQSIIPCSKIETGLINFLHLRIHSNIVRQDKIHLDLTRSQLLYKKRIFMHVQIVLMNIILH